jgi:hypothetical protein
LYLEYLGYLKSWMILQGFSFFLSFSFFPFQEWKCNNVDTYCLSLK